MYNLYLYQSCADSLFLFIQIYSNWWSDFVAIWTDVESDRPPSLTIMQACVSTKNLSVFEVSKENIIAIAGISDINHHSNDIKAPTHSSSRRSLPICYPDTCTHSYAYYRCRQQSFSEEQGIGQAAFLCPFPPWLQNGLLIAMQSGT